MSLEKQYARRSIVAYVSPYEDGFTYRSIMDVGRDETLRIVGRAIEGTLSADIDTDAEREFDSLVEFAASAYAPEHWLIAYRDDRAIGFVFPQRYWDKMEEGSIFSIGVVPEERGKGYGKILHAKGLQELAAMGVEEYVGSTDTRNEPMIGVFVANRCRLTAVRKVEKGSGIVED